MNATLLGEPRLPRPGERILDRYVVESTLATGGMGVVLCARHELLAERFAVKILQPEMLGNRDIAERFLREAQACVALRGEHAVRVFDVGTLPNGLPFMVMELLSGHDLRHELLERGPLPVEEAATWALQACHSLAEAHSRGIVHRDIKPSNLFLSQEPDGRRLVKLIDFGISKLLDEAPDSARLTQTSGMLGSPQYMSPEQVRSASNVDHRSDIWSLGAVIYESLVGIPPFAGDSVSAVSAMIVADEATPLDRLRVGLPPALIDVVERCLVKDRTQRIQSVAELAEQLEPFAADAPSPSGRVSRILSSGSVTVASAGPASSGPLAMRGRADSEPRLELRALPVPRITFPPELSAPRKPTARGLFAAFLLGGCALVVIALLVSRSPEFRAAEAQPAPVQRTAPMANAMERAEVSATEQTEQIDDGRREASAALRDAPPAPSAGGAAEPVTVVRNSGPLATGVRAGTESLQRLPAATPGNKADDVLSDRH